MTGKGGFKQLAARLWLILAAISLLLLGGCWDRMEINDLAIILAAGIDRDSSGKVILSSQIFIPRQSGSSAASGMSGSSGGSPSGVTMVLTAEGGNIAEAMTRLQRKISRNIFWGHCEVIILSQDAARKGIREYLDFLMRYSEFREHAYVFVSEKKAKETLALLPLLERSSAEALREMGNMKLGTKVTVLDLAQSIEGVNRSAVISRIKIPVPEQGQNEQTTAPFIRGLVLFKGDSYIQTVTEPMSIGVLILLNQLENTVFTVHPDQADEDISLKPLNMETKLIPQIKEGQWSIKIQVEAKAQVVLNTTTLSFLSPESIKAVEAKWKEQLTRLIEEALAFTQKELKTDFFGFGQQFRRHYSKEWKKHQDQWTSMFPGIPTEIQVKAHIMRTGKSVEPQGIPDPSIKRK